jgi:hypothetical protein
VEEELLRHGVFEAIDAGFDRTPEDETCLSFVSPYATFDADPQLFEQMSAILETDASAAAIRPKKLREQIETLRAEFDALVGEMSSEENKEEGKSRVCIMKTDLFQ